MLNEQGQWRQSHVVELFPWDAGTEEGSGFSESNASTQPASTIKSIRGTGKFTTKSIARLTFTLQAVTDLPSNHTPYFIEGAGATRLIAENQPAGTQVDGPVSATDPDTESLTYSLGGPDARHFSISSGSGQISTSASLDYEAKSVYTVTVSVRDGQDDDGNPDSATDDTVRVSIIVTNEDDEGVVTISSNQPLVGNTLRATLHDPDDVVVIHFWNWSTSLDKRRWIDTGSGIGDSYTPDADDVGRYLRATAYYNDGHGTGKRVIAVTSTKVQAVRPTPESDVEGGEPNIITTKDPSPYRESRTGAVYTFRARDPEGRPVSWSMTGTDSHAFEISSSGILTFRGPPDFENPTDSNEDNEYEITVVVTDNQGLTDSVDVTVTVTDENEGPEISRVGSAPGSVPEEQDQMQILARYTATDPEGGIVSRWRTSGTDGGDFVMNEQGELRFRSTPDHERPWRFQPGQHLRGDGAGVRRCRYYGTFEERVTVTPVNEAPTITTTSSSATGLRQPVNRTSTPVHLPCHGPGGKQYHLVGGRYGRWILHYR